MSGRMSSVVLKIREASALGMSNYITNNFKGNLLFLCERGPELP